MKKPALALLLGLCSLAVLAALPKVAVLDIIVQKGVDPSAVVPVTESIMEEVVGTRAYVVLDRAYVEQVLKEQEFDVSSMVSDTQAAKAGQYLGADYVVAGKLQMLGDAYFLVAKMIEVRTGIIVSQSSTQGAGKLTALLDMAHSIGKKIVAGGPISPLEPAAQAAGPVAAGSPAAASFSGRKVKAGFVLPYMSINDDDQARVSGLKKIQAADKDWLETVVIDRIGPEGAAAAFVKLADVDKCDIVIACDWGIADQCAQAARRHPKVLFESLGGDYREGQDPNLGVFNFNEAWHYYLQGIVAGALSASGKIGYLSEAREQGPWILQLAGYFALGVRAANPKASILLIYLPRNHWDVRGSDAAAAKALIAQGCDFVGGTDHPELFEILSASTMAGKRVRMFHKDLNYRQSPNVVVSGPMRDFGELYERPLLALRDGTWKKEAVYPLSASKFGGGGESFNPAFLGELRAKKVKTPDLGEVALLELLDKRSAQILSGEFEPFTGPVKDQKGKLRLPAGVRADDNFKQGLDWLPDNVKVLAAK